MIKILIADDHSLLRQGIKRVLTFEDDFDVVGEAEDGQEALAHTLVLQPDILLCDLNMPGLTGMEVTKQLKAAKCSTKIIALTIHDGANYVIEMLQNGASGYLMKDVEPTELIRAIRRVYDGETYVQPELAERVFGQLEEGDDLNEKAKLLWSNNLASTLTQREHDVLTYIAKGFSNLDIANTLDVSEKTVKNHLTSIFRKLGVSDRTQALIYVIKNKIVDVE